MVVHTINSDAAIAREKKEKWIDMEKDIYVVKYADFTPVLVKAIQEQSAEGLRPSLSCKPEQIQPFFTEAARKLAKMLLLV